MLKKIRKSLKKLIPWINNPEPEEEKNPLKQELEKEIGELIKTKTKKSSKEKKLKLLKKKKKKKFSLWKNILSNNKKLKPEIKFKKKSSIKLF